jgi:hypothetical protein
MSNADMLREPAVTGVIDMKLEVVVIPVSAAAHKRGPTCRRLPSIAAMERETWLTAWRRIRSGRLASGRLRIDCMNIPARLAANNRVRRGLVTAHSVTRRRSQVEKKYLNDTSIKTSFPE